MKESEGNVPSGVVGRISRTTLLTRLFPLSFICFFGALLASASFFPSGYNWRVQVISKLSSPVHNPDAYWIASLGIMAATLLASPFAGYVTRSLGRVMPRAAKWAGRAFALGFFLMTVSMVMQLLEPLIGLHKMHTYLAQSAAGFFIAGMLCCSVCALRDRFFGGGRFLPRGLATFWTSVTMVPVITLSILLALVLLGGEAEAFRQSFRNTPLWHLAFWEWVGSIIVCAFLTGSVMLLPASTNENVRR